MTSVCISNCINDARDPRVPVRATYVNLYKWPESDAEFVRSVSSRMQQQPGVVSLHCNYYCHPRVVDSISCRQMYLRSYTFSRKETVPEKTQKCFGRVKGKVTDQGKKKQWRGMGLRRTKESSCSALFRFFHRLLTCSASVDVVDRK
ncbi:hypothetical protein SLEP1_g17716 [Rubroshorea leprosula]|uniref:Uncharacterized protein n=1 Tax=Rubroshorea leprosula TaxID=152421 RepID=A0AAV5J5S2_9ROSI|nr:hypothetical protein SLEP1_g17716 [Rubroshorea leprosula]